jgi:hypothetical protein
MFGLGLPLQRAAIPKKPKEKIDEKELNKRKE